jgi:site-specific recombinase XerD
MDSTVVADRAALARIPEKRESKPQGIDFMSENSVRALLEQPNIRTKKGVRPTATLHGKGDKTRVVPLRRRLSVISSVICKYFTQTKTVFRRCLYSSPCETGRKGI